MFKRFHDKKSDNKSPINHTYNQIGKSKSALKTKYSDRHKPKK